MKKIMFAVVACLLLTVTIPRRVYADSKPISAEIDSSSTYTPTNIINGDFQTRPWMKYEYGGKLYSSEDDLDANVKSSNKSIDVNSIYANGVDKGWNTSENTTQNGDLFEWLDGRGNGTGNWTGYNSNLHFADGQFFVELNASNAAVLYQDLTTHEGDVIRWSFEHAVRISGKSSQEVQNMQVFIGAPNFSNGIPVKAHGINTSINHEIQNADTLAKYTSVGSTGKYAFANSDELAALKLTKTSNADKWYIAKGVYIIPEGQEVTRFAFMSMGQDNAGNLMDDVTFSTLIGNLKATVNSDSSVTVTGYWGETDSTKNLVIKIGDNPVYVDMTAVQGKNFKVNVPETAIGNATTVTIYHSDYPDANKTVTLEHQHDWETVVNGNVVTTYCKNTDHSKYCSNQGEENSISIKLNAEDTVAASGVYATATVDATDYNTKFGTTYSASDVIYYLSDGTTKTNFADNGATTNGGAPSKSGAYVAKLTVHPVGGGEDVTAIKTFNITLNCAVQIPIRVVLDETPDFDVSEIKLRFKLTPVQATTLNDIPLFAANEMPMPESDAVEILCPEAAGASNATGYAFGDSNNPWKFTLTTAGKYTYEVSYVASDDSLITGSTKNTIVIYVSTDGTVKYDLNRPLEQLTAESFNITQGMNAGGEFAIVDGEATLRIGGTTPSWSTDGFDSAAAKTTFAIDFTQSFSISGRIRMSKVPDGAALGFVPSGVAQNQSEVQKWWCNGVFGDAHDSGLKTVPVNGKGVFLEFDSWGNASGQGGEDQGTISGLNTGISGKHIGLLQTDVNGEPVNDSVASHLACMNEAADSAWPNEFTPYSITYNKDTKDLTFRVGSGVEVIWNNPVGVFGTDKAYFVMGANIRFGPMSNSSYGLSSTTQYSSISFTNVCYNNNGQDSIDNFFELGIKNNRTNIPSVSMNGYTYGQSTALPVPGLTSEALESPAVVYYYNTTDSTVGAVAWENIDSKTLDAGTYYMFAKLGSTANYRSCVTATTAFTILAETNSWTTEPAIADVSYGTSVNAVYAAKLGNDTVTVTYEGIDGTVYASSTTAPTAAGSYKATLNVAATTNYSSLSKEVKFKINKSEATITTAPAANSLTYNGAAQPLVTEGISSDGELQYKLGTDGTYTDTVPTAVDAGTYIVYYKVIGDDNHIDLAETPVQVTISPLDMTEAAAGAFAAMTYTGNAQTPEATVTVNGLIVTGNWSDVIDVTDTTTFTANGNFTGTIANQNAGMQKATVTAPAIAGKVYSGSLQAAEVTASELYTVAINNGGTTVGSYDVVLTLKDPSNYRWTDSEDAEKILKFTITAESNSWMTEPAVADLFFGTPVNAVYEARFGNNTVAITYEGVDGTNYASSTTAPTAAGSYKATFTAEATADYGSLSKSVEFRINKVDVSGATVGAFAAMTYTGNAQTPEATVTVNGLIVTGNWSNVTNVADTTTFTANGNFTGVIADMATGMAKVSVTAPTIASKVYNGSLQTADVPASTLYTTTTNNGGTEVGSYDVVLTLNDAANYKWTNSEAATETVKFEITARPKYAIYGYSDTIGNAVTADPQNAEKDTKITLTIIPADEYSLQTISVTNVSGASITLASDNTFVMPESEVTVNAVFTKNTYDIASYSDAAGNTVTADLANAVKGEKVTLKVSTTVQYKFKSLTVSDAAGNTVAVAADNTFVMPGSAVTVAAVFEKEEPIIIIVPVQPQEPANSEKTEDTTGTGDTSDTGKTAGTSENEEKEEGSNAEESADAEGKESTKESEGADIEGSDSEGSESGTGNASESIGVNPITEKKNAFVIDNLISAENGEEAKRVDGGEDTEENGGESTGTAGEVTGETTTEADKEAEKEAVTKAIVEAIETAIAENNTKDFILKADEQTVTEQGIENKAYADAATEAITAVTKPAESRTVTLESAVIETLANAEEVESLTVMTSVADVEFDAQTIESINEQSDGSVQLVVTLLKEEIAQNANEDNKVYFDVSLIREDGTKITTFDGGSIKVTVPIPKACQNEPVVVVYTDSKGHYSPVNGVVNSDGTFTFITEHLSEYILMTKREAEEMYNSIYDFSTLKLHVEERTADSITIDWDQYEDADGYIIYGNYCNHDGQTYKVKKLATITDPAKTEYTIDGLEGGTNYKFRIKAFKLINGEKYVTVKSHYVHAVTLGGKQRVTADIKIDQTGMKKTNTVTLKEGQSYTIDAERLTDSGKAVHHVTMHYESSDASVATVSLRSGKITATGKGTCTVLAIAENGLYEEITVKVK